MNTTVIEEKKTYDENYQQPKFWRRASAVRLS